METILIEKLRGYITLNNPDLLIQLQSEHAVTDYLKQKVQSVGYLMNRLIQEGCPPYIIEELCLEELTNDLHPSEFTFISNLLEEEFEEDFLRMKEIGTLTFEIVNLIAVCKPVFETVGFNKGKEDDRELHYTIAGEIKAYLENR